MDFSFTAEQDDLRDVVRSFFVKHAFPARPAGTLDRPLWTRMATELGLTGLAAYPVETAIVLVEAGRVLLPLPYLSTVVAAGLAPPDDLPGIVAGSTIATVALDALDACTATASAGAYRLSGVVEAVLDGDIADLVLVAARLDGGSALFRVPLALVDRTAMSTLDQTRPVARLSFRDTAAALVGGAEAVDRAGDLLHRALAVESIGVAAASLSSTVAHLKTRRQFGQALAGFQALRHRVADLYTQLEAATSSAWYAVRAPSGELPITAPLAKLVAADAAYAVTAESIQLHGGIGFTWEHDAHRYFKRATVTRATHGDPVTLRRLLAARAGLFRNA
jgi:alkylation response protein AidB-like acyl-CoA dehydrogenase